MLGVVSRRPIGGHARAKQVVAVTDCRQGWFCKIHFYNCQSPKVPKPLHESGELSQDRASDSDSLPNCSDL